MTLDKALTVIATRYSPDRKERWIAAVSAEQGFSIQKTVREQQPNGPTVYVIDRTARLSYTIGRQFDDWELDWNDGVDKLWE
jgi:hypothetical protein